MVNFFWEIVFGRYVYEQGGRGHVLPPLVFCPFHKAKTSNGEQSRQQIIVPQNPDIIIIIAQIRMTRKTCQMSEGILHQNFLLISFNFLTSSLPVNNLDNISDFSIQDLRCCAILFLQFIVQKPSKGVFWSKNAVLSPFQCIFLLMGDPSQETRSFVLLVQNYKQLSELIIFISYCF